MTEPAVGASVWASGSQVWKGNMGTLMAKAKKKPQKSQTFRESGKCCAAAKSVGMSKVCDARCFGGVEVQSQDAEKHQN